MTVTESRAVPTTPLQATEAFQVASALAHRKTGTIPEELLVTHILESYPKADWAVQRAALEAALRRIEIARQDRLQVATRPPGRNWRGIYLTRRPRAAARPYRTLLLGVDPLHASCDCPDFLSNGLGLCKHVLVVLDDLAGRKRSFARARAGDRVPVVGPRLSWDPIKPLHGPGDWLDRVRWNRGEGALRSVHWRRLERATGPGVDGLRILRSTYPELPRARLKVVEALEMATRGDRRIVPSDPALIPLLAEERQRLELAVQLGAAGPQLRRARGRLRRKLYDYQREGVERFLTTGRLLLADDMGLGKTTQAVAACSSLWSCGEVERGLVVAPASLKFQWLSEWQACTDVPAAIVEGSPDDRQRAYKGMRRGFLIVNYEQLLRDLDLVQAWRPDLVVLDEAQRIKNWETRTAKFVKRLQPRFRLVMTGTPFENRLSELDSLLEWVDRRPLEPTWRVTPFHCMSPDGSGDLAGVRNLDTLRERLAPVVLRRRRAEILSQLPPRTDTRIDVEITDEQATTHADLSLPIARLLSTARRRPLTREEFLRLMSLLNTQRVVANGMAQLEFGEVWPAIQDRRPTDARLRRLSMPKLLELREIVERVAVEQCRKIVVFSQWRRALNLARWACSDVLGDHGLRSVFFTGAEGQKLRTRNIVTFHDDPDVRVLFASDAGGVGLNLQRAATCCVNFEVPWNPAVLEQRIGRIYRLGQEQPIETYTLISSESIEARIAQLVADKKALFSGLFDGDSDEVMFENSASFLDGVRTTLAVDVPTAGAEEPDRLDQELVPDGSESRVVAAADEAGDPARDTPSILEGNIPDPATVGELFERMTVTRAEDGGIRIETDAAGAATLGALFQGMAQLMLSAGGRDPTVQ